MTWSPVAIPDLVPSSFWPYLPTGRGSDSPELSRGFYAGFWPVQHLLSLQFIFLDSRLWWPVIQLPAFSRTEEDLSFICYQVLLSWMKAFKSLHAHRLRVNSFILSFAHRNPLQITVGERQEASTRGLLLPSMWGPMSTVDCVGRVLMVSFNPLAPPIFLPHLRQGSLSSF